MEEMMMEGHEGVISPTTINGPPLSSSCWKFYQNPCFHSPYYHHHQHYQQQTHRSYINLPLSARKLAASFSHHISFFHHPMSPFPPSMHSDLDIARTHMAELTAEIEFERRLRKQAESMNKRLAREVLEERRKREAMERACEELAKEIACMKEEIDEMKREMEEERKMLRIAEVWREERVQMKLSEARIFMEEKMLELSKVKAEEEGEVEVKREEGILGIGDLGGGICGNSARSPTKRKGSLEVENPHIRRGIKGFVEFPKVVRAVGSRGRQLGSKLECQKAQLRLFLRQKNPVGLGVAGPDNVRLVMG
ncbi:protein BRANCHLESS TRICHOME-like [Magnolia sinica]|uniref:protein BRANCHLESS TRICHOME-like n=1 Tax=Magnolia sinica TaxID=86752 RepID=UPI00265B17CD|nr:protein BRANCHLESS TRICHOME-like [Magnolia sinica]